MSTTYLSLSLSQDGTTLVDLFVTPMLTRRLGNLIPLASLDAHPRAFVTEWLGAVLLVGMPIYFKDPCARYALAPTENRLEELGQRLKIHALGDPPIRPEHLRLFIDTAPDRLLITRERPTGTAVAANFLLAALALGGRDAAARKVGRCVLDQLTALHPDAFAPFPALAAPLPPNQEPP